MGPEVKACVKREGMGKPPPSLTQTPTIIKAN